VLCQPTFSCGARDDCVFAIPQDRHERARSAGKLLSLCPPLLALLPDHLSQECSFWLNHTRGPARAALPRAPDSFCDGIHCAGGIIADWDMVTGGLAYPPAPNISRLPLPQLPPPYLPGDQTRPLNWQFRDALCPVSVAAVVVKSAVCAERIKTGRSLAWSEQEGISPNVTPHHRICSR